MTMIVSADIRATTVLCVNILALIRLRLYSCTSSLSSHVGWVLNDCTTYLTCKLAQQSACLGGSTWPESKHLREVLGKCQLAHSRPVDRDHADQTGGSIVVSCISYVRPAALC